METVTNKAFPIPQPLLVQSMPLIRLFKIPHSVLKPQNYLTDFHVVSLIIERLFHMVLEALLDPEDH